VSALLTRGCLNKWQDERRSSAHTTNLTLLSTTDSSSTRRSLPSPTLQAELSSSIATSTLFCLFSRRPVDCPSVATRPVELLRRSPRSLHTPLERHCKPPDDQQHSSATILSPEEVLTVCEKATVCLWSQAATPTLNCKPCGRLETVALTPHTWAQQSSTLRRHYDV
jgi:hypothetical protein